MTIASLIISILAILFSLYTYFVHDKKIKDQTKLINDYQLQKHPVAPRSADSD